MHRSAFSACLLLAACSEQHAPSERPDPQERTPVVREGGAPRATSSSSGDSATSPGSSEDETCGRASSPCVARLDVEGMSPMGALHIRDVSVDYTQSLSLVTLLRFSGTLGSEGVQLFFVHHGDNGYLPARSQAYATEQSATPRVRFSVWRCLESSELQVPAELRVSEHSLSLDDAPLNDQPFPTHLRGELRVTQPGWSLTVPFTLDVACSYSINLI
jgi:hypothetical protein